MLFSGLNWDFGVIVNADKVQTEPLHQLETYVTEVLTNPVEKLLEVKALLWPTWGCVLTCTKIL